MVKISKRYIYNKELNIAFCIGPIMIDEVDTNDMSDFLDYLNIEDNPKIDVVQYLYNKCNCFGMFDIFLMVLNLYGDWKVIDSLEEVEVCKVLYINDVVE